VTDENPLHSGSRWEPAAHPTPAPREPAVTGSPAAPRPPGARRGVLAAAVAGLVAVGGLGGLAFGHAVTDEGSGRTGQVSQLGTTQPGSPT
jgi:hypothetical protein